MIKKVSVVAKKEENRSQLMQQIFIVIIIPNQIPIVMMSSQAEWWSERADASSIKCDGNHMLHKYKDGSQSKNSLEISIADV